MQNAEFNDPRLAQLYDMLGPWGPSDQFFLDLANESPHSRILDLGCGTGQITLALAEAGHSVTGIDPATASLDVARAKPRAEQITWIEGTSAHAPAKTFNLAMMTNHVAQFITDDGEWAMLLADLHRALVPGGQMVFDSRDPAARGWEKWNPSDPREQTRLPDGRGLMAWTEVTEVAGELVTFVQHYVFAATGTRAEHELLSRLTLRFRPERKLRSSLEAAGFEIEAIYGGWTREPVGRGDGEFIVIARVRE